MQITKPCTMRKELAALSAYSVDAHCIFQGLDEIKIAEGKGLRLFVSSGPSVRVWNILNKSFFSSEC